MSNVLPHAPSVTECHPAPPEQRAAAVVTVAGHARTVAEFWRFVDALGLRGDVRAVRRRAPENEARA